MKPQTSTGLGVNVKQAKPMSGDEVANPHTFVNTLVYLLWQVLFASKWRRTQKAPFFSIGSY